MCKHLLFVIAAILSLVACDNTKRQITDTDTAVTDDTVTTDDVITDDTAKDDIATDELATDEIVTDDIVSDDLLPDEEPDTQSDQLVTDEIMTDTDLVPDTCGNSVTDSGEECDGDAKACTELPGGYTGGYAACKVDCSGWDTVTCTGGDPVELDCAGISQCVNDCSDTACVDACYAAGTTEGKGKYEALMNCMQANCAAPCGSGGSQNACIACLQSDCETELDECLGTSGTLYGTVTGAQSTFAHIYDGNGNLGTQIQANQAGLVSTAVFTGAYGSAKILPGAGATQTMAFAAHYAATAQDPAIVAVMQRSLNGSTVVNPMARLAFPHDTITPAAYEMNPMKAGSVSFALLNLLGGNTTCLLALSFSGATTVTAAANTTATSGGSIALNMTDAKIYHPTETPMGDISAQVGAVCPKE